MFTVLYKSNIIENKDKTLITFIVSAITYSLIHYIIFNDFFNSFEIINYIHIGFYIIFFVDFCFFIKMITEDKLNDEIINSVKEKEAIQDYYGKIIEQLSSELNTVQKTKPNTDEQKQEKEQEFQQIETQETKEKQNNTTELQKEIEITNEEKAEDKEN